MRNDRKTRLKRLARDVYAIYEPRGGRYYLAVPGMLSLLVLAMMRGFRQCSKHWYTNPVTKSCSFQQPEVEQYDIDTRIDKPIEEAKELIEIKRSDDKNYKKIDPIYATIHHTAGVQKNTDEAISNMLNRHTEMIKKWRQQYSKLTWSPVAYHFIVWVEWDIVQIRNIDERGSHQANYNSKAIGIAMIGTFRGYEPTDAQYESVSTILRTLESELWRPFVDIRGHHEHTHHNHTDGTLDGCPWEMVDMERIKNAI